MIDKQTSTIFDKAKKDSSLLTSSEYIEASFIHEFGEITYQVGPYCNLRCDHCYGSYGPNHPRAPNERVNNAVVEQAFDNGLDTIRLSDGEPLVPRNMDFIASLSKHGISTQIVTNGTFGYNRMTLDRWVNLLGKNSWSVENKPSRWTEDKMISSQLKLSQGVYYPEQTLYAIPAIHKAFGEAFGPFRDEQFVLQLVYGSKVDGLFYDAMMDFIFSRIKVSEIQRYDDGLDFLTQYGHIRLEAQPVGEVGKGIKVLKSLGLKEKLFKPQEIGYFPNSDMPLHIGSDGTVSFASSAACVVPGRSYGNIMESSLENLTAQIHDDPVFWAFRLGGTRFMYHLAQQEDPYYKAIGIGKCNVCRDVFSRVDLLARIRKRLKGDYRKSITIKYLDFMAEIDAQSSLNARPEMRS